MHEWSRGRDDFAGIWLLERRITDHLGAMHGRVAGEMRLQIDGSTGLIYDESGWMTLDTGLSMPATRRYLWAFDGPVVLVSFADGKPFHTFVPAAGAVEGTHHLCGDDIYRVQYNFTAWPVWTAEWRVTGPRKDYTSRSVYRPQESSVTT